MEALVGGIQIPFPGVDGGELGSGDPHHLSVPHHRTSGMGCRHRHTAGPAYGTRTCTVPGAPCLRAHRCVGPPPFLGANGACVGESWDRLYHRLPNGEVLVAHLGQVRPGLCLFLLHLCSVKDIQIPPLWKAPSPAGSTLTLVSRWTLSLPFSPPRGIPPFSSL